MSSIEVNGGNVVYEILGDSGDLIVLTPGGRFSMEIPGLRPLAEGLVAGGYRVLLWDRPNCGASDVQFYGQSESHMRAETLHGLLGALGSAVETARESGDVDAEGLGYLGSRYALYAAVVKSEAALVH